MYICIHIHKYMYIGTVRVDMRALASASAALQAAVRRMAARPIAAANVGNSTYTRMHAQIMNTDPKR